MKLSCGPDYDARCKAACARLREWHRWFTWHPVRVGPDEGRWLEYVERKGTLCGPPLVIGGAWSFTYRTLS